jgi:hypothetical protein
MKKKEEKLEAIIEIFPLLFFSFISKLEIKKHVRIGKEILNDER